MLELRLAQDQDLAAVRDLWKVSFQDPDEYIQLYYRLRYKASDTFVVTVENQVVTMLTILPTKMVSSQGEEYGSAMYYAIATHPDHQNKGFASHLMEFTDQRLVEKNVDFSILVPANRGLFQFYKRLGYEEAFFLEERILQRRELLLEKASWHDPNCQIYPVGANEYNRRRQQHLKGQLYVAYPDADVHYQKLLCQHTNGDVYAIDLCSYQGCAVIERYAERLLIKELLIAPEVLPTAMAKVAEQFPAREYLYRTPAYPERKKEPNVRPFGVIKALQHKRPHWKTSEMGFLGLAFD